jgi:tetratricopeptide (TPR) repeat protein
LPQEAAATLITQLEKVSALSVMSIFVKRYYLQQSMPGDFRRCFAAASLVLGICFGGVHLQACVAADTHNYSASIVDSLGKAQVAADQGHLSQAKTQYEAIIKLDSECPEAYAGLGHVLLLMGRYADAEPPYKRALALQPNNANLYNGLGNAAYRQGHYSQSIENFEQALKYASDDKYKIHANLANALSDSHHVDEAIKHFASAIELNPNYAPAYNGLSTMYYNNRRYEEAVQNARKAISLKPDYAMGYYNLGISLIQLNQIAEAKASLRDSLKYEKNASYKADTLRILAKIDSNQTQPPSTIAEAAVAPAEIERMLHERKFADAEKAIETEIKAGGEHNAILWNNMGYALMHQSGKERQAKQAFEKAIACSGGHNSAARYNLGQLLRTMNDTKGAEAAFRKSIEDAKLVKVPCALAQNALGLMLKQRNDLSGAEACYRKALMDAGGDLPVIHYNRAIVLERMEHSRDAVREYKAYLAKSPNGANAKQAQMRLHLLGIDPG